MVVIQCPQKGNQKKAGSGSIPDTFLNIIGQNMLQSELLLSFLKEETGLNGECFSNLESIAAFNLDEQEVTQLFILDWKNVDI